LKNNDMQQSQLSLLLRVHAAPGYIVGGLKTKQTWESESRVRSPCDNGARIEDSCLCLTEPLLVAALLDAAGADNSVVEALAAKGNPALQQREAAAEARGEAKGEANGRARGMAEAILRVLEVRNVTVNPEQRQEILDCQDLDRLDRWLRRAAVASSSDEITSDS
jgi:hypothetical protein